MSQVPGVIKWYIGKIHSIQCTIIVLLSFHLLCIYSQYSANIQKICQSINIQYYFTGDKFITIPKYFPFFTINFPKDTQGRGGGGVREGGGLFVLHKVNIFILINLKKRHDCGREGLTTPSSRPSDMAPQPAH